MADYRRLNIIASIEKVWCNSELIAPAKIRNTRLHPSSSYLTIMLIVTNAHLIKMGTDDSNENRRVYFFDSLNLSSTPK